jgi:hypothetical protein
MLWVTVVGIVGYATLRQELTVGYWLASLTGILYVVFTGLIMTGLLGPVPTGGPVIGFVLGPIAQTLYAAGLVVASYLALRERGATGEASERRGQETASAP